MPQVEPLVGPGAHRRTVEAPAELREKNQITLPKRVVEALGLHPGDRLVFTIVEGEEDVVRMVRLRPSYAGALAGVYGSPDEVAAYLREEREAWGERA